jgi:hypothetical protein
METAFAPRRKLANIMCAALAVLKHNFAPMEAVNFPIRRYVNEGITKAHAAF